MQKRNAGSVDLTNGSIPGGILAFTIPLFLGQLLQQFYNMVDAWVIGNFADNNAFAAVSSTGTIVFLIIGFFAGIATGGGVIISRYFGAQDEENVSKAVHTNFLMGLIASVIGTAAGLFLAPHLLVWMGTPDSVMPHALSYLRIYFGGVSTVIMYNICMSIMRALGDSIHPLYYLLFSSIVNILLDLLFVAHPAFHWGVAGAAVATVVAQAISGVGCLIYMCKKLGYLHFTKQDWAFSMRHCLTLCGMGVPMGLQYSITAIGSVILQAAVNSMGESVIAAVSAGTKISMFLCCPFDAMGSTMATYGGQNVGAKKMDRVDAGLKACIKLGIVYAILAFVFILLFGKNLALLFLDAEETEIIKLVYYFLLGNSGAYILLALVNIVRFMIQGLGYSAFAVIAGICEMVARTIAGFILVPKFGYVFVALGSPLAWIFADIFLIPAYIYVVKRLRRKFGQETPAMLKRCQKSLA